MHLWAMHTSQTADTLGHFLESPDGLPQATNGLLVGRIRHQARLLCDFVGHFVFEHFLVTRGARIEYRWLERQV